MVWGGELGAVYLVVDAVRRPRRSDRLPGWMAIGLVVVLLVANPWIYESISFDSHYQSVGAACFAIWPEMWKSYGIMGGWLATSSK